MRKQGRIMLALLCALCLLPVSGIHAEPNTHTIRNIIGRIEQGSISMMGEFLLVPDNCSGFELRYRPDLPDSFLDGFVPVPAAPETDGETGMVRCPLEEETARRLLEYASAVSIGPDGSTLWCLALSSRSVMFVQHGKVLVLLAQSAGRGVPDTDGSLRSTLDRKQSLAAELVEGEVRWSPDSRFLFFNDTERWRGAGIALDDPFLTDTQTGEVFLIDSGGYPKDLGQGTFRCVMNGRFSLDGKSFYWYCRSYASGRVAGHSVMRYDLESGARETVCTLENALADFCEVNENNWYLLESAGDGLALVRMTVSPDGAETAEELRLASMDSCGFLPAVRGTAFLSVTPLASGGTYLLPLAWDTPASSSSWYKIGSVRDGSLREIAMDNIETEVQEARRAGLRSSSNAAVGTANIKHAAAIIGVTDLLLTVYIREPVPDSWGGGLRDFSGQVILNTENLKLFPIRTAWAQDGLQDSLIDGTCFLVKNDGQYARGLLYADTLPEVVFLQGETYSSPYGSFMCRNESDPLVLSSVTLENRECTADVTAVEGGYTIRFHIADHPVPESVRREFRVPEVLTEARWEEVTFAMGKKDRKKLSSLYTKSQPDKLADRANGDVIRSCYPAIAAETLYILKNDISASGLESAESALAAAGYTPEDYERDMELAAVPQETNIVVSSGGKSETYPVRYTFTAADPALFPASARIEELAGLCEKIGSAVMANRLSPEPMPLDAVILDKYDMISVDLYVALNHAEETETTLDFTLAVTP